MDLSTTEGSTVPAFAEQGALTPERLTELRSALAAFASAPLVTLEAHPLPVRRERSTGLPLDAMSPLARELSRLVTNSLKVPTVTQVTQTSEVLYRMHVPAKVASQFGRGFVKPMTSKAVNGGIYGDLVASTGKSVVAAKATFVPVEVASAGATGTAVGAAAGTAAAGTALTVAAPLVLMAVAVGASAYADHERQKAIENITELLEKLHDEKLESERSELDGCRDAVDKATAPSSTAARSEHHWVWTRRCTRSAPRCRGRSVGSRSGRPHSTRPSQTTTSTSPNWKRPSQESAGAVESSEPTWRWLHSRSLSSDE